MKKHNDEVLFKIWSNDWQREVPCILVHYDSGRKDINCQTGGHIDEAIKRARTILLKRGLIVGDCNGYGLTGAYFPVSTVKAQ